ncbi:MAG: hypothetical protein KDB37_13880, partial [Ilumatobacter sp.]|nr:hypothetical protein [Ilumatobacter sp.]
MSNTLLTPSVIAREALMTLYSQTVMLPLVHRDFDADFAKVGDTVTVRKPATFTANEFTGAIAVQDATESSVAVQMNHHLDVSFAVTSKELTLSISDFRTQLLDPAMEAIAQKVDQLLLSLYVDVYNNVGTAGTTPDGVDDITGVGRVLDINKVPLGMRSLAIDAFAKDKFLQIPSFFEADKVGDDGSALRNASLGRKFGLDTLLANNIAAHDNGTIAHTGTFAVNGAVAEGATTMAVDGSTTLTGTWSAGSLFTVAGVDGTFVVTADADAAANAIGAVSFAPAAPAGGFADDAVVTRIASHTPNLGFHKTALAFVTRPLELPMGVGAGQAEIVNYGGLGLRVVADYD